MMRYLFVGIMSLALTACFGGAPEKQRYQLPVLEAKTKQYDVTQPMILLQPVELSELLYQSGIVLQTDDITLSAASHHLWSSDLQQQITLGLQKRLQQRLPQHAVLLTMPAGQQSDMQSLLVRIDAFQGHFAGYALTEGQWQLVEKDGSLAVHASVNIKTQLEKDGYAALVRALGKNLDQLADKIALAIREDEGQVT